MSNPPPMMIEEHSLAGPPNERSYSAPLSLLATMADSVYLPSGSNSTDYYEGPSGMTMTRPPQYASSGTSLRTPLRPSGTSAGYPPGMMGNSEASNLFMNEETNFTNMSMSIMDGIAAVEASSAGGFTSPLRGLGAITNHLPHRSPARWAPAQFHGNAKIGNEFNQNISSSSRETSRKATTSTNNANSLTDSSKKKKGPKTGSPSGQQQSSHAALAFVTPPATSASSSSSSSSSSSMDPTVQPRSTTKKPAKLSKLPSQVPESSMMFDSLRMDDAEGERSKLEERGGMTTSTISAALKSGDVVLDYRKSTSSGDMASGVANGHRVSDSIFLDSVLSNFLPPVGEVGGTAATLMTESNQKQTKKSTKKRKAEIVPDNLVRRSEGEEGASPFDSSETQMLISLSKGDDTVGASSSSSFPVAGFSGLRGGEFTTTPGAPSSSSSTTTVTEKPKKPRVKKSAPSEASHGAPEVATTAAGAPVPSPPSIPDTTLSIPDSTLAQMNEPPKVLSAAALEKQKRKESNELKRREKQEAKEQRQREKAERKRAKKMKSGSSDLQPAQQDESQSSGGGVKRRKITDDATGDAAASSSTSTTTNGAPHLLPQFNPTDGVRRRPPKQSVRSILSAYLHLYDPSKNTKEQMTLLTDYQGREEELWSMLEEKYGANTVPAVVKTRNHDNYLHLRLIPRTTQDFNGTLRAMLACGFPCDVTLAVEKGRQFREWAAEIKQRWIAIDRAFSLYGYEFRMWPCNSREEYDVNVKDKTVEEVTRENVKSLIEYGWVARETKNASQGNEDDDDDDDGHHDEEGKEDSRGKVSENNNPKSRFLEPPHLDFIFPDSTAAAEEFKRSISAVILEKSMPLTSSSSSSSSVREKKTTRRALLMKVVKGDEQSSAASSLPLDTP